MERRAAGVKFINDLISGIIMTTATKSTIKLPVVSEPHFVPGNCFRYYAFQESAKEDDPCEENENTTASHNYLKGLRSLHEGYLAGSLLHTSVQNDRFQRAFGYFHQALAAKPDYFCAREALRFVAERLGYDDIAEREEYALELSGNPHPGLPCHLLHAGFFSASDLENIAKELKF